ncbi:MAG: aminotransferase class IV [Flavobacteriaceae bacterium]|nr:aminotransferase class IV [Flavobacteriaceae bacterium]
MINYNGTIISTEQYFLSHNNRGFKYGDALFETLKVEGNSIIFSEDHYFRLMASMRMIRMKIPMTFTQEFFEEQINKTVNANQLESARVRFTVFRKDGGLYLPNSNDIDFVVEAYQLDNNSKQEYEIDIFKDHYVLSGLLSTLKSNNKLLNVVASVYADENGLDNCVLLNEKKNIVEAINGNIFLVKANSIITPSLTEGCLKGIIRKKIIEILQKDDNYEIIETEISPFELQKADEVFITNSIVGIQSVTRYKKKTYTTEVAQYLKEKLKELEAKN